MAKIYHEADFPSKEDDAVCAKHHQTVSKVLAEVGREWEKPEEFFLGWLLFSWDFFVPLGHDCSVGAQLHFTDSMRV